jgi:hypothetical protein
MGEGGLKRKYVFVGAESALLPWISFIHLPFILILHSLDVQHRSMYAVAFHHSPDEELTIE